MTQNALLTRTNLRTPRAAAIAGILFSVLAVAAFWLLWTSVPADPYEPGSWLGTSAGSVALCLNLVPFAGIAFLWFIGVLRDHLATARTASLQPCFLAAAYCSLACFLSPPRSLARSSPRSSRRPNSS